MDVRRTLAKIDLTLWESSMTTEAVNHRHQVVLQRIPRSDRAPMVMFRGDPSERRDPNGGYRMPREQWEDFGKPDVITLTVEPGDLLNPDA